MRLPYLALCVLGGLTGITAANAADEGDGKVRESVVKIFATMRAPDPFHPWQKQSPRDGSGTGVVIEGKRILTNAHVVSYASQIFVESSESSVFANPQSTTKVSPKLPSIMLVGLRSR